MKTFLKNQNGGQVTVLMALSMTIVIAVLAVVVDFGSLYLEKNRLQKITDAAVLAGAQELPGNITKAKAEINKVIQEHNGNLNNFTIKANNNYTTVEVIARKNGKLFFASALGVREPVIEASSKVQFYPVSSGKGAIPLGVPANENLSFGSRQVLMLNQSHNGNFGALQFPGGSGASNFEMFLKSGYPSEIYVGQELDTEPGRMSGPTSSGLAERISSCPNSTYLNYPPGCKRVVLVPIYETDGSNNVKKVTIVGFGTFFIENTLNNNTGEEIIGRFIRSSQPGEPSSSQADFGTYSFKLTR